MKTFSNILKGIQKIIYDGIFSIVLGLIVIYVFIYVPVQKYKFDNQISPLFLSGILALIILGFGVFYLRNIIWYKLLEKKEEGKKIQKFWIVILVSIVLGLIVFLFPLVYKILGYGFYWEEYFSHIWLCSIICFYTAFSHYRLNSFLSPIVSMSITAFFSVCVFLYASFSGASTLDYFKHIYKLFDHLLLSKQLSFFNILTWLAYTVIAYIFYTSERYSGKGDSETCVWNTKEDNKFKKLFIAVLYFVFVIYPFILSWRTYSLENTVLVNSRYPLLFFSIWMFLLFLDLFLSGRQQKENTDKKQNCDKVGKIDYGGSVAFNYIIWMCVGLLCNSIQIYFSKNEAVKSRSIAGPIDSIKNFLFNLFVTLCHSFGTIFGGATLWKTI